MELILWRHAEAVEGSPDLGRHLTKKGQLQAKTMAKWLKPKLNKSFDVWVSEAVRSQQTAAALSQKFQVHAQLNPDCDCRDVIQLLYETHWEKNVLLVGHQPWIGRVCAQLMGCLKEEAYWSVKKGAIWWLDVRPDGQTIRAKTRLVLPVQLLMESGL